MKRNAVLIALLATLSSTSYAQIPENQKTSAWYTDAQKQVDEAKKNQPIVGKAKNVILFVGDGMSVGSITAARIWQGQQKGLLGEEYKLNMESMPNVALAKTYNTDMQTPDSAGTATAMVSGVKTKAGVISVNENIQRSFCNTVAGNETKTLFEMAAEKGVATGVVSTARITHATPATTYAHSADRDWENDSAMPNIAKNQGCLDIAQQLVNFNGGKGLDVMLGGGRREFLPETIADPEYADAKGKRKDGQNLIEKWQQANTTGQYVYDKASFDKVTSTPLLGLFEPSHMQYEADRKQQNNEPSLAEMTGKAIDLLSKSETGYVMMVEAGRIDHAHHEGNAARALEDTVAYDEAIRVALEKTDPKDTLIIVTADHAHTMIMNGYSKRGNNILGLADDKDANGKSYTTITYGNGPGGIKGERTSPDGKAVLGTDYIQQALIPLGSETHSPEDVAIFARGPQAWLFQGVVEQNYIFHVINDATGLAN